MIKNKDIAMSIPFSISTEVETPGERALKAFQHARQSVNRDEPEMTLDEINEEIRLARAERKTVAAYNSSCDIVSLRNHILDLVNNTEKIDKLEECLGILTSDDMPGIYSDEEFKKEVEFAEKEGFVSDEEFKRTCYQP